MRHQHYARGGDEARVDVRLVGVHVEARRAEPPLLQGESERLLADQIAPRRVDENGCRLHLPQGVAVDDALGLGHRRDMQREHVALLEEDRKSTRLNSSHGYISYA